MMTSYRKSLMETLRVLEEWSNNQDIELPKSVRFLEDDRIHQRMVVLVQSGTKNRLEAQQAKEELKSSHAISVMASQVAHDIRSPLAALDSILGKLAQIPEDDRIIIRSAVNRIKDIANNLIEKNRELKNKTNLSAPLATNEPATVQLLSSLVEPLITEKRMQFRSKIGIEIDGKIDCASYGLFVNIQPTEFKRVLSNLVNNSVEAMDDRGAVTISLVAKDKQIEVSIKDNGKGIPAEILNKLGARGETHGKKGGSGLGIFHARTSVESWGGSLEIQSEIGSGTAIKIRLPQVTPPEWFVSELRLLPSSSVVILDDDTSIHQIWQGRFDSLQIDNSRIKVHHFSTPDEITMWVQENSDSAQSAMYLADYELIGHQQSGLDVIEKLGIGPKSILVTSRFEEKHILEGCKRLRVRLIPKGMAGFVPIKIEIPLEQPDCVLIDDDELVHLNWNMVAKDKKKILRTYLSPASFLIDAERLDRSTPIYVDAHLGDNIRGDEISEQIFNLGFKNIFMTTGYEPQKYQHLKFLSGVIGKEPPWLN